MTLTELRAIAEREASWYFEGGEKWSASIVYEDALNPRVALALLGCAEALACIASKHKPRHDSEEYWLKINHEQCATVLATDTKIARKALAALKDAGVVVS